MRTLRRVGRVSGDNMTGRLWVEEGEHAVGAVAEVALVGPVEKLYTYRVTPELAKQLAAGQRVNVPVGKRGRLTEGFCIAIDQKPWDNTLRPIDSLIDAESFLTDDLLELGRWISRHYACPLGRTLGALVPDAVRKQAGYATQRFARLTQPIETIRADGKRLGGKQKAVLTRLGDATEALDLTVLLAESGASRATVRAMESRGWIEVEATKVRPPAPDFDQPAAEPDYELNADQQAAVERVMKIINARTFRVGLLHGVSGSGKTEVYIHAMREVVASGGQAVMLVPEIALTTQLVQRLASRFQDVAVVHSGLTGVQRSLTWAAIRSGEKKVVIGTRSAVFAPCPNLGLIVVDEEQEGSYKNLQAPRFHVRDVAIKRGQQLDIPVLLGSATPSLESYHNCARFEHFERIDLPHRVKELPLPTVTVVDMNDEYQEKTGIPLLSRLTLAGIEKVFSNREQAVVLMNRRGYASWVCCGSCKHRIVCPDCNVNMVYHASRAEMLCHFCGRRTPAEKTCPNPSCNGRLLPFGSGTQRVEERLKRLFTSARIARVDSDTMRNAQSYQHVIQQFESREIDCIVGTQMIAKGLDFPFVSFVGVIGADTTRSGQDFRSDERLFQLVTQVAGRAGRSQSAGAVVVQTLSPDSPALRAAINHDYASFAERELTGRRMSFMPPFSRLARVVTADPHEPRARESAQTLAENARTAIEECALSNAEVLGPAPCVMERIRNRYRYEIVIRCATAVDMQKLLDRLRAGARLRTKTASMVVDVDPVSLV